MDLERDRPPWRDLRTRVDAVDTHASLPLVHISSGGVAREIISCGQLRRQPCSVFGTDLVYFFLAKPAYRFKGDTEKEDLVNRFPVAFILDAQQVVHHQVYPFDTGAAFNNLYPAADRTLGIKDYELTADRQSPLRMMAWAFRSLDDYMNSNVRNNLMDGVPDFDQVTQSYDAIARRAQPGSNQPDRYDGRAVSIEIASNVNVSLQDAVSYVIMPENMIESAGTRNTALIDRLVELGISIETYPWAPHETPYSYISAIEAIIRRRMMITNV